MRLCNVVSLHSTFIRSLGVRATHNDFCTIQSEWRWSMIKQKNCISSYANARVIAFLREMKWIAMTKWAIYDGCAHAAPVSMTQSIRAGAGITPNKLALQLSRFDFASTCVVFSILFICYRQSTLCHDICEMRSAWRTYPTVILILIRMKMIHTLTHDRHACDLHLKDANGMRANSSWEEKKTANARRTQITGKTN